MKVIPRNWEYESDFYQLRIIEWREELCAVWKTAHL